MHGEPPLKFSKCDTCKPSLATNRPHTMQRPALPASNRQAAIAQARAALLEGHPSQTQGWIDPAISRSWQRCLAQGLMPGGPVVFAAVATHTARAAQEASAALRQAARPVLQDLGKTLARTGYFALLTDSQGLVIDVFGPVDPLDRRATNLARVGVDLSEAAVGTTAIGLALAEQRPVWLHRDEHFYAGNRVYSCAGAPLWGPDGQCLGMLDLTGIDSEERPQLQHLVLHAAQRIEQQLTLNLNPALVLRLNWPGQMLGSSQDGLVGIDAEGYVVATNQTARQILGLAPGATGAAWHCEQLFATGLGNLFDAAHRPGPALELPLWSGLWVQLRAEPAHVSATQHTPADTVPLKDLECQLILQAVKQAKGNVAQAARSLGISRATVYRKISK